MSCVGLSSLVAICEGPEANAATRGHLVPFLMSTASSDLFIIEVRTTLIDLEMDGWMLSPRDRS